VPSIKMPNVRNECKGPGTTYLPTHSTRETDTERRGRHTRERKGERHTAFAHTCTHIYASLDPTFDAIDKLEIRRHEESIEEAQFVRELTHLLVSPRDLGVVPTLCDRDVTEQL
jgi:hypothetical protein